MYSFYTLTTGLNNGEYYTSPSANILINIIIGFIGNVSAINKKVNYYKTAQERRNKYD